MQSRPRKKAKVENTARPEAAETLQPETMEAGITGGYSLLINDPHAPNRR
jgi:hypothetical protein